MTAIIYAEKLVFDFFTKNGVSYNCAKRCANTCVDNLVSYHKSYVQKHTSINDEQDPVEFFKQVKLEISKL